MFIFIGQTHKFTTFILLFSPSMYKLKIICFRRFVSFSWYIINNNLNIDLKIQSINKLAKSHYLSFHTKISNH